MDRAPGLSVRLKLTLSYAGFLMLAGVLMLAAVWVVVLRYIPDGAIAHLHPSWWFLFSPSDPLNGFASVAAIVLAFLLVFGLAGRVASRRPHARPPGPHHRRHTHGRDRIALPPDPAGGPQRRVPRARRRLRRHARAARSTRRRTAAIRSQRLSRTAHPAGDHTDASRVARNDQTATSASSSTASTPSTPGRSTSPKRCSCSAAPTNGPSPRTRRPVPHSGRSCAVCWSALRTPRSIRDGSCAPARSDAGSRPWIGSMTADCRYKNATALLTAGGAGAPSLKSGGASTRASRRSFQHDNLPSVCLSAQLGSGLSATPTPSRRSSDRAGSRRRRTANGIWCVGNITNRS